MSMIEALMGKKDGPARRLAAMFAPRKTKRHALPAWAQAKSPRRPA